MLTRSKSCALATTTPSPTHSTSQRQSTRLEARQPAQQSTQRDMIVATSSLPTPPTESAVPTKVAISHLEPPATRIVPLNKKRKRELLVEDADVPSEPSSNEKDTAIGPRKKSRMLILKLALPQPPVGVTARSCGHVLHPAYATKYARFEMPSMQVQVGHLRHDDHGIHDQSSPR